MIPRPRTSYRFVSISDLGQHVDRLVDLLAIVEQVFDVSQVTIRATGEPQRKRSVKLVDQSAFMTDLTLWGDDVDLIESSTVRCPVSLKSVSVKHYNGGYSVSTSRDTIVTIDPEHSEQLRHWYSTVKPHMALQSVGGEGDFLKEFRVIGIADAVQLGRNDQRGEFFTVVARVMSVRSENAIYQACSREGCKKKVVSMDGLFRCEKCNTNNDTFKYVAILSMDIFDFTGEHQVTLFEECVQKMLGHSSEELGRIREESETAYNAVFDRARFQVFNMKIAAKPHLYQDEESVRWTVRDISAVSIDQHEQALVRMLECIEKE